MKKLLFLFPVLFILSFSAYSSEGQNEKHLKFIAEDGLSEINNKSFSDNWKTVENCKKDKNRKNGPTFSAERFALSCYWNKYWYNLLGNVGINLEHIFDLNNNNNCNGFHHDPSGCIKALKVVGENEPYYALVPILRTGGVAGWDLKTFFPRGWSRKKVLDCIGEAYKEGMHKVSERHGRSEVIYPLETEGWTVVVGKDKGGMFIQTAYPKMSLDLEGVPRKFVEIVREILGSEIVD